MAGETDPSTGVARLDEDTLQAALGAAAGDSSRLAAVTEASGAPLPDAVLTTLADPVVEVVLEVASAPQVLRHRVWLRPGHAVLVLAVRPGLLQLVEQPPDRLTAALVRLTRMRPRRRRAAGTTSLPGDRLPELVAAGPDVRRAALADAGADFAWRLRATWDGGGRLLTAVDGPRGLHLAGPDGSLVPTSNTEAYRILSVLLPTDDALRPTARPRPGTPA